MGKKNLIALAVLGLSGAAMAQSSVTLYGEADAGIGKQQYNSSSTANGASNKTGFMSGSTINYSNSRIGLRGVEDLGGGLKTGFNFESGLDLDDGSILNGTMWGRQAHMWIGGNWGTLKLGRQFTRSYYAVLSFDVAGTANYSPGPLSYQYGGIGSRANSEFAYISPDFNGLTVSGGYIAKKDMALSNVSNAAWEAAAVYTKGPIIASLAVNKTGNSKTGYLVGGKYNFGSFNLVASYTQASNQTKAQRRGVTLGGTAFFGPFSVSVDLVRDIKNQWGPKKYTNGVLQLKYSLSKRDFLYATYLRMDGSYQGSGGLTSHGSTNNYIIGIHHYF